MKFSNLLLVSIVAISCTIFAQDDTKVSDFTTLALEKLKSTAWGQKLASLAEASPEVKAVARQAAEQALEKLKSAPIVQRLTEVAGSLSVPKALEILAVRAEPGKPTVAEAYAATLSPDKKAAILREAAALIAEGKEDAGLSEERREALKAIATLAADLKKSGKGGLDLDPTLHQIVTKIKETVS